VAYVLDTYASATATAPSSEQLVVRDLGGQLVRVVSSVSPTTAGLFSPVLSPDGNTVLWNQVSAAGLVLRRADVGTGTTSTLSTSMLDVVYVGPNTLYGFNAGTGHAVSMPATGGAQTAVNIPDGASELSVSPALNAIAWTMDTSTTPGTTVADVQMATLDAGTNTVGTPTTLATGQNNHSPSWDVQNLRVDYIHDDGIGGQGDVKDVDPSNPVGTTPTTVATPQTDEQEIDIVGAPSVTSPGGATATPAVLKGTSAVVGWTLPGDGDLSGVLITRKLGSTVQKANAFVPAPLTTYTDTGLTLNTTYTYVITAVNRSGLHGPDATRTLTAIAAAPTFADPTSTTSVKAWFPVAFAPAGTPNGAVVTADFLKVGTTTWNHWVTSATGRVRTFGAPASTGVLATTSVPGTSYVFRAQVRDYYGNATPYVSSAHAVVPFDQTKASLVGGLDVGTAAAYLGSYRRLSRTADYAKVTLVGNRLQVLGWRCGSCGAFAIYDGSTLVATVDTRSSSTLAHVVLYTRTYSAVGTHTFTIRPKATAGRPYVYLDGFAMRR
jgi:hypothetical protein